MDIKLEIYTNKMVLNHGDDISTVHPVEQYATKRLLVGTFQPAVDCLKKGLKEAGVIGLFKPKVVLFIHAREMSEGGLSEVEQRCLNELGLAAGAQKVEIVPN